MSDSQNLPVPAPQNQFAWTEASTVASMVGIFAVILTICTLIYDRVRRGRLGDRHYFMTLKEEMGYFWTDEMGWWRAFWKKPTETPKLTTIRGLIEAGDINLWSSAAFDQLQPYHKTISWTPIYSAIYSQIAKERASKLTLREDIDAHTKKFLDRALEAKDNGEDRRNLIREQLLIPCLRPLDETDAKSKNQVQPDRLLQKSSTFSSIRIGQTESTFKVIDMEKSLKNSEDMWMRSGRPCIEISREELLAISLTLGITLHVNDFTQNVRGLGPFGTGLNVVQDNGEWKLEVVHGARIPRHRTSRGSGYTSLFAKHIAFGSLPFLDTKDYIRSVYVSFNVLKAIKRGDSIIDGVSFGGGPLQILKRLPGFKQIDAYYHWSAVDELKLETSSEHQLGHFYKSDRKTPVIIRRKKTTVRDPSGPTGPQQNPSLSSVQNQPTVDLSAHRPTEIPVPSDSSISINTFHAKSELNANSDASEGKSTFASWTRAVTGIVFGGLVPQSSKNLARAVEFTVDNFHSHPKQQRTEVENLINKIEELINQLQAWDSRRKLHNERKLKPSEKPFGDFVAERAPTEENIDNVYYAIPLQYHDTQEAGASFARYTNLLERMVALYSSNDKVQDVPGSLMNGNPQKNEPVTLSFTTNILNQWRGTSRQSIKIPRQEIDTPERSRIVDTVFEESCKYIQTIYFTAVQHQRQLLGLKPLSEKMGLKTSPPENHPAPEKTLSQHVQLISEKISNARKEFKDSRNKLNSDRDPKFKITLHDCVLIVRCILVVWANQVPKIQSTDMSEKDPEDSEEEAKKGDVEGKGKGQRKSKEGEYKKEARVPGTNHPASLMDLPQVMAFA